MYDGTFTEDDKELPMILFWFKKVQDVSKTIVETKKIITTTYIVERNENHNVGKVKGDLKDKLSSLIQSLQDDQKGLFKEEEERINVLSSLDAVHQELLGEHKEDIEVGGKLKEKQTQISKILKDRRVEIDSQKKQLSSDIKSLEDQISSIRKDIDKSTTEKQRLTKIVETPEDLKEKGLSKEAKTLRDENEKLRKEQDKLTDNWVKERDLRNTLIADHQNLVQEYNRTIEKFTTLQLITEQDNYLIQQDLNNAKSQLNGQFAIKDSLLKSKEVNAVDIAALQALLDQMRKDFEATDKSYNAYTDILRQTAQEQGKEISKLRD